MLYEPKPPLDTKTPLNTNAITLRTHDCVAWYTDALTNFHTAAKLSDADLPIFTLTRRGAGQLHTLTRSELAHDRAQPTDTPPDAEHTPAPT